MLRTLRSVATIALCLLGAVFAVIGLRAGTLVTVAVTGALLGLAVQHLRRRADPSAPASRTSYLPAACVGLTVTSATVGLIVGTGWSGLALAGLMAATWIEKADVRTEHVLRRLSTRLITMSDASLCYVWVTSSRRLRGALSESERLAIVMNRACVLDELERRDPAGFANWTAHGVGMNMDPRRFINSDGRS